MNGEAPADDIASAAAISHGPEMADNQYPEISWSIIGPSR